MVRSPPCPCRTPSSAATAAITETVSRDGLWRAQTPQAFHLSRLKAAYGAWKSASEPTDDAQVIEAAGGRVALVPGDPLLMKLTYPEDFQMAEQLAGGRRRSCAPASGSMRTGSGRARGLAGRRPHSARPGLVGHSDADAGLHALTDALLGAIAEGDIGQHFPPPIRNGRAHPRTGSFATRWNWRRPRAAR